MLLDLDTITGVAVYTAQGRTFHPDTRILGLRDGVLWLTQDVTGSEEYDYEDVAPDHDLLDIGQAFALPLTPYRLIPLLLSEVYRFDIETVAESDEDSMTTLALEYLAS